MLQIDLGPALKDLDRDFDSFQKKQIPFGTALALTSLGKRVAAAETQSMARVFDRPTPFTQRAMGVVAATKASQVATVYAKDIQAAYLSPFLSGGQQVLDGKKAILKPAGIALNAYGNIPKGKIAALKGKPDTFVGPVTFRSGQTVSGVWQRPVRGTQRRGAHGVKGSNQLRSNLRQGITARTGLKLLIRFADPVEVKERLPYEATASSVIERFYREDFAAGMGKALATAR